MVGLILVRIGPAVGLIGLIVAMQAIAPSRPLAAYAYPNGSFWAGGTGVGRPMAEAGA